MTSTCGASDRTAKPAGTDPLEAFIDEWDADRQHTLLSHSRLVTERLGLYEAQVQAQ